MSLPREQISAALLSAVDSGRPAWTSPLLFRAAGAGYVVARDAASVTVGAIMDVATGRSLTRVQMPEGYDLEEVRYLCADKGGFDLFSWSPAGELRRFHLGRREEIAYLAWVRRLRQEPSRLDPCDPVILVETPIPGRPDRGLRALTFKKGKLLGPQVEQSGWWPAMASSAQAGDIEIVTADGLELRDRKLGNIRSRSKGFVGGRVLASWANQRLVRSVAGTALLIDENGIQQWLGAPANIAQVVLTPSHLLAGPWAGSSRSGAENLVLYRMPKARPRAFEAAPRAPPPPPPLTTASLHRMPKQETPPVATFAFPEQGDFEVTRVALAGETLYLTAGPNPPRPGRGIGLAAFDLARRSWTWYREQACAANAEVVGIAITDDAIVCATRELYPGPGVLSALARDSGTPMWTVKLPTVDRVVGASGTVVALAGSQALVIDAARGEQTYELFADNGHLPRAVLVAGLVIAVEPDGHIVARSPDGTPRWSVAVAGYISELRAMADAVAVHTHAGELYMLDAGTGASRAVDGKSMQWKDSGGGDLAFDSARGRQGELILWAYDARGQERFRAAYPTIIDWQPAPLRSAHADAPVLLVSRGKQPRLMHIDPRDGQVQARHLAPSPVYRDSVFSAVVKGRPQVGLVLREGPSVQLY